MFGGFGFGFPYFGGGPIASAFVRMVCAAIHLFERLGGIVNMRTSIAGDPAIQDPELSGKPNIREC